MPRTRLFDEVASNYKDVRWLVALARERCVPLVTIGDETEANCGLLPRHADKHTLLVNVFPSRILPYCSTTRYYHNYKIEIYVY